MVDLFFPNSSGDQRSDSDQSQIIGGGDAAADHTQNIGGYVPTTPSLLPLPPGFRHPCKAVHDLTVHDLILQMALLNMLRL